MWGMAAEDARRMMWRPPAQFRNRHNAEERKLSEPNDPTIEDRKVAEIKHLLSEKRFDEAFDRSIALTREAPGNAEGWWRLTLAAQGLKPRQHSRSTQSPAHAGVDDGFKQSARSRRR
jgi:hypothetical protein